MSLEAASFLNDLNTSNPDGADSKDQGDDHIRLLKTVLKATFPGLAGISWRSQTKSSGYTPIATDNMTVLNCTAALTLSMTAAATLGNGYLNVVHANGGDVTIDPNGAELVNGAATFVIPNGFMGMLLCNGSAFVCGIFPVAQASIWSTGDVKTTYKVVADPGWVMLDDGTIGDATSGGTTRANADTVALFTHLWNNTANADCAVSGGRGATAAADYAAHKTIALPKFKGRALAGAGTGAGLSARALASVVGSENAIVVDHGHGFSLNADANGNHAHTYTVSSDGGGNAIPQVVATTANASSSAASESTDAAGSHGHTISGSITNAGSSGTGANLGPRSHLNGMIKL